MQLETMPRVPTREQIERLQAEMANLPQVQLPTEHLFVGGMYCRKMSLPKDLLVVGKVHRHAHFFILAAGQMIVWTEQGMRTLLAGDVVCSGPGTKRVLLCLTDCIGMNVHKTDKTDIDEIERELIEPDEAALFDARNELKKDLLPCS